MAELYLDTNALIGLLDPEDSLLDPLFADIESGPSFFQLIELEVPYCKR